MTIDEHFLWMVFLESLIFFLGIWIMYRGQKKQTDLIESIVYNPDYAAAVALNAVKGFMDGIDENEEDKERFFRFMNTIGLSAVAYIKSYYEQHGTELIDAAKKEAMKGMPPAIKKAAKVAEYFGIDVKGLFKQKVKEKAEAAIEEAWT